jgi:uncharacterized caspase-like protein
MWWFHSITFALRVMVALLLLVGTASAQPAERRVALVIGNGQYHYIPQLANPTNDAQLIAETLTGAGFTLVGGKAQLDLDKMAFDRMVQEFSNTIPGAEVALFYYAGHGVQVRGANYLVPVSANPTKEADVDFQLVQTDLVLRQMELAGTRLNLLILDACRNNPFAGRGLRAAAGGLAQMQAPEGTLISYATQPGNVAQDGADGHSPYTTALANAFRKPGLDLFAVFNETGLEVKKRTGGAQQPWVSSSPIAGQFYFAGAPDQRPLAAPAEAPQGVAPSGASPQTPSPPPTVAKAEEREKAVAQDKQTVTPSSPIKSPQKQTNFEDKFDRDNLGELYKVLNPDPNRLAFSDGKLLLVATEPLKNFVVLQQTFSGDFVATLQMTMQVTDDNKACLYYWVDENNLLRIGVYGWSIASRHVAPSFVKVVSGQVNAIEPNMLSASDELKLADYMLGKPGLLYIQLERKGLNYTGRLSVDGSQWITVGTHTFLQKGGRLALGVRAGKNGIENAATFSSLVVQGAE